MTSVLFTFKRINLLSHQVNPNISAKCIAVRFRFSRIFLPDHISFFLCNVRWSRVFTKKLASGKLMLVLYFVLQCEWKTLIWLMIGKESYLLNMNYFIFWNRKTRQTKNIFNTVIHVRAIKPLVLIIVENVSYAFLIWWLL